MSARRRVGSWRCLSTGPFFASGGLQFPGEEVGFIRNLGEVRRGDRRKLREALGRGYFIPSITRINELRYRFHVLYFDVETDRGPTKFELRDRTENLTVLGSGKLVAEDVDGNRYVVDDINALDPRSRALLDPHI